MKAQSLLHHASRRLRMLLMLWSVVGAALIGAVGASGVAHAATSAPTITANAVTATATPDGTLTYKITIDNDTSNNADLQRTDVVFRYDPNTLTLVTAKFNDSDDFVSKAEPNKATVQFGSLDNGDARSAYLVFHVNPNVAVGGPIQADVSYTWTSTAAKGTDGFAVGNVTVVGAGTGTSAAITPSDAVAGTTRQITANGFGAKEQIVSWLNLPDGSTQNVGVGGEADSAGGITLTYAGTGLAPGAYSLVLHGLDGGHEYVVPFAITAS